MIPVINPEYFVQHAYMVMYKVYVLNVLYQLRSHMNNNNKFISDRVVHTLKKNMHISI